MGASLRDGGIDFWTEPVVGRMVDIRVPPHRATELETFFNHSGLHTKIINSDIQSLIAGAPMVKGSFRNGHSMDWMQYHPLQDMYSYWDHLEATYDFVSTETIGQSYEGTDMRIIKVCRGGCGNKPAMWIDGGIHAREWISPAVATYMAMELVENNANHPDLTQDLDWYILPVMNPDGYKFTQTDDRMWRKTRNDNGGIYWACPGTDANRNWGFHWGCGGSSGDPCSLTFMGFKAFDQIETQNARDFLMAHKDRIKFYMNLHSYSQLVLLPWGWGMERPNNWDAIYSLGTKGNAALKAVHGTDYKVDCVTCLVGTACGGALDWTLGEAGIPYSFAMELRDTGHHGFLLPPDQIIPNGEEAWAFHMTVAREIITEFRDQ